MFKAVISYQIAALPDDVFAQMSFVKFSNMIGRTGAWNSPCSAIRPAQLSFLPPDCFPAINGACAAFITPSHMSLLSVAQVLNMRPLVCDYFTAAYIGAMQSNLAGLTAACIGRLNPTALSALVDTAALFLQPEAWGAMNATHINNVPITVWKLLPPESLSIITPEALNGILIGAIGQMNPKAFRALSVEQFWVLQHSTLNHN
jgi:hypothetical protein